MLGADAPLGFRLAAAREGMNQIGARADQRRCFGASHEDSRTD
jgi:hypothetical protein